MPMEQCFWKRKRRRRRHQCCCQISFANPLRARLLFAAATHALARAFRYSHGASASRKGERGREGASEQSLNKHCPLILLPSFLGALPSFPSLSFLLLRSCIQISDPFPPLAPSFPCTPLQGSSHVSIGTRREEISAFPKTVSSTHALSL